MLLRTLRTFRSQGKPMHPYDGYRLLVDLLLTRAMRIRFQLAHYGSDRDLPNLQATPRVYSLFQPRWARLKRTGRNNSQAAAP